MRQLFVLSSSTSRGETCQSRALAGVLRTEYQCRPKILQEEGIAVEPRVLIGS